MEVAKARGVLAGMPVSVRGKKSLRKDWMKKERREGESRRSVVRRWRAEGTSKRKPEGLRRDVSRMKRRCQKYP